MVLIFGWGGGGSKDHGEIAPATCPRCHNDVFLHHVTSNREFSLFFVPLATYGGGEYLLCPICKSGLPVQPAHRGAVTSMGAATRLYRRGGLNVDAYQTQVSRFWGQVGLDGGGKQVVRAAPTIPAPASTVPDAAGDPGSSLADQLAQLARLKADGILTDEEFAAAKNRLLNA